MLEIISKRLTHVTLTKNDESNVLEMNGKFFYVTDFLFNLISDIKRGLHSSTTFIDTNKISLQDYEMILSQVNDTIDQLEEKSNKNNSYIKWQFTIMPQWLVGRVSQYLTVFFNRRMVYLVLLFFIAPAILFFLGSNEWSFMFKKSPLGVYEMIAAYLCFGLSIIVHELGHAASSYNYGINPGKIGFGFYLIFPVLFTDVSKVWRLDSKSRIVVNLSGVYFHLIITATLILIYLLAEANFLLLPIQFNFILISYSLLPFVRNDGYWVVSDLLRKPNLNKESYEYVWQVLANREQLKPALLLYSVGQYVFLGYLIRRFYPFVVNIITSVRSLGEADVHDISMLAVKLIFFFIYVIFLFNSVKVFSKSLIVSLRNREKKNESYA